jgi:predicted XRE-type DNA-binding protein
MSLLDVFKPKWQSSDLSIRRQAVQSLNSTDLDALLDIAKNDEVADIRKLAIQKISSPAHLSNLLKTEQDTLVQNAIKESLKKQWFRAVKNHIGEPNAEIRQILANLQEKDKQEILPTVKSVDIRLELVKDCAKQGLLAQIAQSDSQERVAMAALAKIERENLVEEIKDKAFLSSVRLKAKEIFEAMQNAKIDPEKEQANLLIQKQRALQAHAARLLENKNPLSVDSEMQRLYKEASALGLQQTDELNSVFAKHKENIEAQKAIEEQAESEKEAKKEAKKEAEEQAKETAEEAKKKEDELKAVMSKQEEQTANAEITEEKLDDSKEEKLSEEEYNAKLPLLQAIIEKVNALDENGDFNENSQSIRQAFYEWKEIVGEKKSQFKNIYKDFRAATGRFQNQQEWASWHAEQTRGQLIKEIEELAAAPIVLENRAKAFTMLEQWKNAGYMPAAKVQEFWPRFKAGLDKVMDSVAPLLKEQEQGQEENLKVKGDICEQIEELAATEGEWVEQLKKVQDLQTKWKNAGFVPKAQNHAIWERYQAAVNAFFKKQEAYKKRVGEQINERIAAREKLCEEAELLANSTDWKNTPKAFTKLSAEWKTAGSVPTEQYEKLLQRFKAASDSFFEKRHAYFDDARKTREQVCAKIETLNFDATNADSVAEWKEIEKEWVALEYNGFSKELHDRFFAASDRIWEAASKSHPEIAKELDKNWEIKHELMEQLKNAMEQGNFKYKVMQSVKNLQIEWEKTGRCGVAEAEISSKFAEQIKSFFAIYSDQREIRNNLDKINAQKKEELCRQAEELLEKAQSHSLARTEIVSETNSLRASWRESGNVSMHLAKILWKRFNTACNAACHIEEQVV